MDITPDTSEAELATLSTADRRSERRRSELERIANVLVEPRIRVRFHDSAAFAHPADDDDSHDFEIHVPDKRFEQVEFDMPDRVWDQRVQIGILFHELGHIKYSDFERFGKVRSGIDPPYREVFRSLYNATEDVVIEAQHAEEFHLRNDFTLLNDAFRQLHRRDHERYVELFSDRSSDFTLRYTVFEALLVGIHDSGFGTIEWFEDIVDPDDDHHCVHDGRRDVLVEIQPELEAMLSDLRSTTDGTERVDRCLEFFRSLRPKLEGLPLIQSKRVQTRGHRPIEAGTVVVTDPLPASELDEGDSRTESGGTSPTEDRRGSDEGEREAGVQPPERTFEAADTGSNRFVTLAGRGSDESPLQREAKRLLDIVRDEENDVDLIGIQDPSEQGGMPSRWIQARRSAQQLASDLRTQLRRRRRTTLKGGHKVGRLDPHRIVAATQGRERVFRRREQGDERDYSCLVVIDRSGSMTDRPILAAEEATAQLTIALSSIGVDVSVLSLFDGYPWLELPFGTDPDRYASTLMSTRAHGSTPLSAAVTIARERILAGTGTIPLLIVVTDGVPDRMDLYREALERCSFPVYGIYIQQESQEHANWFDRVVYTDVDAVDTAARGLARNLFTSG